MPDTRPITDSFPWLAVRYRAVFNNENTGAVFLTDDKGNYLTDDQGNYLLASSGSLGDRYRLI